MEWEYHSIHLSFHKSWDWLLPVWIKFRDLETRDYNHGIYKEVLYAKLVIANSPSDFFPHLVEAVKWHQSTKK